MAAITRWSTGSAVCSAVLRSPPLPSEPLLALRSANQLPLTYPSIQSSGSTSDSKNIAGHYRQTDPEARYIRLGAPSLGLVLDEV